eukprot:TRINITY_DN949_c0_g1_i1.p1 TRINITY_DN949_c0_g1~~TRINITY_DN949_c0_g1_i1.p1  ORF type:complete len:590 (+),score=125.18 TRINITY_DN949_c0_g1_i1:261-1772(+)
MPNADSCTMPSSQQADGAAAQRSAINNARAPPFGMAAAGAARYPLVTRTSALVTVVKAAMNSRADRGQHWLDLACASADGAECFDLAALVAAAPAPWLRQHTLAQLRELYAAALKREKSVFDLPCSSPSLDAVVEHILNNTAISASALVLACIYVDRVSAAAAQLFVTRTNVQRLFGVAFMLAAKWHEDAYYSSAQFAALYGMSVRQLNELESAFTAAMRFELFVSTEQFHDAQLALMSEALDSACSLRVLQALVRDSVAHVHKAFDGTRSWGAHPHGRSRRGLWAVAAALACDVDAREDELDDEVGWREFSSVRRGACEVKGRKVVAQLALAQLQHDFGGGVAAESFSTELARRFAENGVFRYVKLQLLAGRQELDDLVLPPLERVRPTAARAVCGAKVGAWGAEARGGACARGEVGMTTWTALGACCACGAMGGAAAAAVSAVSAGWAGWAGRCHHHWWRHADASALRSARGVAADGTEWHSATGIWCASQLQDLGAVRSW